MKGDNAMKEFQKPYLRFRLEGFNSLNLRDNTEKICIDNEYISSIFINDDLTEMYVELREGVTYEQFHTEICTFLDGICFNMLSQVEVDADVPYYMLELVCDGTNYTIYDRACISDSMSLIRKVSATNFYDKIISEKNAVFEQHILYQKMFEMLHNPNTTMRFLGLYDLLLSLLSRNGELKQKYVHDYLGKHKERYQPDISFFTNKDGKSEDTLTNLRNKIAHCEQTNDLESYRTIGSQIPPAVIRILLKVLNDVICEKSEH